MIEIITKKLFVTTKEIMGIINSTKWAFELLKDLLWGRKFLHGESPQFFCINHFLLAEFHIDMRLTFACIG